MAAPLVLAERHGQVLLLTLNRPGRLNAWTEELEASYFAALDEAEADPAVRAVVLTGAGRAFCAGFDLDGLLDPAQVERIARGDGPPRLRPYLLRKPLIAAINGATAGLGLVQALYCDVRFGVPEAKITTAFAGRGLIAEYGIAWLLPRLVGAGAARDLLLSARVVAGREARELGLLEHLASGERLLEDGLEYASRLAASCSPSSVAAMKEQLRNALGGDFAGAYAEAQAQMARSLAGGDFGEGVRSFREGRPPRFEPLAAP